MARMKPARIRRSPTTPESPIESWKTVKRPSIMKQGAIPAELAEKFLRTVTSGEAEQVKLKDPTQAARIRYLLFYLARKNDLFFRSTIEDDGNYLNVWAEKTSSRAHGRRGKA